MQNSITRGPADRSKNGAFQTTGIAKPHKPSLELLEAICKRVEVGEDIVCHEVTGRVSLIDSSSVKYQVGTIAMTRFKELIEIKKLLIVNGTIFVAVCRKFEHTESSNGFLVTTGYDTTCTGITVHRLQQISKPLIHSKQEHDCHLILNSHIYA